MDERARAAAEQTAKDCKHAAGFGALEHLACVNCVADAVAQAVKEWKDMADKEHALAVQFATERDEQAEEIARLKREIKNLLYGGRGHG